MPKRRTKRVAPPRPRAAFPAVNDETGLPRRRRGRCDRSRRSGGRQSYRPPPTRLPDAARLDLTRYRPSTKRALYRLSVAAYWTKFNEADEYAQLTVHFWLGRWFVTWHDLKFRDAEYVEDRQPLMHIEQNPARPFGLRFTPL
jgi:hypothetical protein